MNDENRNDEQHTPSHATRARQRTCGFLAGVLTSAAASVMLPFTLGSPPCVCLVGVETGPADAISLIVMEPDVASGVDGFMDVLSRIGSHVRLTVTIDINVT
ncbi:hypothetical protein [Bifidobacterium jacchi]|uniref:Uncharacterized protein n=1 Tax=Bifidobacterium jacchi TaxID=2490545 RepID=A0A5N5RH04_9BIFI|nr:hypothetical protein [Bifidobacterium jacchi]KAB5606547.1 hypothetical protein EHS19_07145 [Bifidobacterium jacchi]